MRRNKTSVEAVTGHGRDRPHSRNIREIKWKLSDWTCRAHEKGVEENPEASLWDGGWRRDSGAGRERVSLLEGG